MAFWATEIKPSKNPTPLILERRVVIKQAALVISKSSPEPCVLSVSVKGSDQQFVVCRLHEGRMEHCTLELPFSPQDRTQLFLKGPHTVHLTGFLELDEEDELAETDEPRGQNGTRVHLDGDDDDDDDEDDEDFDEEEDDDEGEDDDEEDDEDEDEDEEEEEEVVLPPPKVGKKHALAAAAPPAKKQKAEAPAAAPAKKAAATTPKAAATTPKAAATTPKAGSTPKGSAAKPSGTPAAATPASVASPMTPTNTWSKEEDAKLQKALAKYGGDVAGRWEKVAADVGSRNATQCKKRAKAK